MRRGHFKQSLFAIFFLASFFILLHPSEAVEKKKAAQPIQPLRIVIDPGHGGKDPGAMVKKNGREKDLVLSFSKKLSQSLQKKLGAKVFLTRSKDIFVPLEKRNQIANQKQCDVFISIHANASKNRRVQGIEVYYLNRATDRASAKLADRENEYAPKKLDSSEKILSDLLQAAITEESAELAQNLKVTLQKGLKRYPIKKIQVKTALFYVLVGPKCPNLLIETGFLTHPQEGHRLKKTAFQKDFADAVADGIGQYLKQTNRGNRDL